MAWAAALDPGEALLPGAPWAGAAPRAPRLASPVASVSPSRAGSIPFFAVANSLIIYLMEFVIAIAAVVSPMATKLSTQGKMDELREIFLKWSKVALSLSMLAGLFLIVLGPKFIGWWIDPSFEHPSGDVLQILMVSSFLFLPVRGVALPILMGLGKPKAPTIAFVAAGLLNLTLSIALARPLGLVGVALGTAIPNVLFAIYVLSITCRELDVSLSRYVWYVIPRATVGALPILRALLVQGGLRRHAHGCWPLGISRRMCLRCLDFSSV